MEEKKYVNLDKTKAYDILIKLAAKSKNLDFKQVLTSDRIKKFNVPIIEGLNYNYAAKQVTECVLDALQSLAKEQDLIGQYKELLEGAIMNTGEGRRVLHQLLRSLDGKAATGKAVMQLNKDLGKFYLEQRNRFFEFADMVRAGEIVPAPGKRYTVFCQIGIGGSDLMPRALAIALENWAAGKNRTAYRTEFISNVDPDDASKIAANLPLDETLFILVSKSGTTQETLTNELFIKSKLEKAGLDPKKHFVAVTSETSPLANNPDYLDSFYFDDAIGGRYSVSSAVGGVIISLAYGSGVFREFLTGAAGADAAAMEPNILKNAALLDALIGVFERLIGYPYSAVLPYSQALLRFPAHLQQLDMESNGKQINRYKEPVAYSTGPVIFGEPGTNGQHSFYQLIHQGTDIIPLQFIGFKESQRKDDIITNGSTSQAKLKANLAAQITAFANGKSDSDPNKEFPGGRPSSLIYGESLTPKTLGALLAHYENKIMFQGFIWNINSFDQEGVQLGKKLAEKLLSKTGGSSGDPVLDAYAEILEDVRINNKKIISAGSLLLDIGLKCGKTDKDVEKLFKSPKLKFKAPAAFEIIDGGKQVVVDFSQAVNDKIAKIGKRKFDLIGETTKTAGGGASNSIIGIQKMTSHDPALSCHILAKIGAENGVPDEDGSILLKYLQKAGIETDLITYDELPTGRTLVLSIEKSNGERDVLYLIYRGASEKLKAEELQELNLDGVAGGVVANTNDPANTLKTVRWLSGGGRRVVYISSADDMNFMRDGDAELLKGFENVVMTANEKEFAALGADPANEAKVIESFAHAIISRGTDGIRVYDKNLNYTHYPIAPNRPEFPLDQINPNGAGDAMSASIASKYVPNNKFDIQTIKLALCVAACVCTRPSTTAGVPVFEKPWDDVKFTAAWRADAAFNFSDWKIK